MLTFFLTFIGFLLSFCFGKILQGILIKKIYKKYILIDSMILALYFGLFKFGSELLKLDTNPGEDALIILLGIFIIPFIYSIFKKFFLKAYPGLHNMYYPIWEFMIFLIGIIGGMILSEFLNKLFA